MMQRDAEADEQEVILTISLKFKPDRIDEALERLAPIAKLTREEPGNVEFSVFRARDDGDQLLILERWTNQAALEHHWQMDYTKDALALFEQNVIASVSEQDVITYLRDALPAAG